MGKPRPLFAYFTEKNVDASGIRIWIVGVEGKHTDFLTITTALHYKNYYKLYFCDGNAPIFVSHDDNDDDGGEICNL